MVRRDAQRVELQAHAGKRAAVGSAVNAALGRIGHTTGKGTSGAAIVKHKILGLSIDASRPTLGRNVHRIGRNSHIQLTAVALRIVAR